MREYFDGFSTQDYIDMRRADDERNEKKRLEEEIKKLKKICARKSRYIDKKDLEIGMLTAESTEWESKYYEEAKKNDRAIEYINKYMMDCYDGVGEDLLDILEGKDNG